MIARNKFSIVLAEFFPGKNPSKPNLSKCEYMDFPLSTFLLVGIRKSMGLARLEKY